MGMEVIPLKYKRADWFYRGIVKVNLEGKVGYIDSTENAIIPFNYDHITDFHQGIATTFIGTTDEMGNNMEGKYGMVDISGKELIPAIYDNVDYNDGFAFVSTNGKYGLLKNGKEIIPFIYDGFMGYSNGLILVFEGEPSKGYEDDYDYQPANGKYGFIDTTGTIIIPLEYEDAIPMNNNLTIVKKDGLYGIIDNSNKKILAFTYDKIFPAEESNGETMLKTMKDEKFGCINESAELVLKPEYDNIDLSYTNMGLIIVTNEEKQGIVNTKGDIILKIKYDYISIHNENMFNVSIDDDSYMIDSNGKKINN
jgi:hypothetical protein